MQAAWALAGEKAAAGNYGVAKQAITALVKLMAAAGAARKTEAKQQSGSVVSDTATGKELMAELKGRIDLIKAALGLMPTRVAEGKQLISDVNQGIKDPGSGFCPRGNDQDRHVAARRRTH